MEFVIGDQPFSQWEEDEYEEDDDDYDDEFADEELEEGGEPDPGYSQFLAQLMLVRERGAQVIEDWLVSQERTPSPLLADALLFMLVNVMADSKVDSEMSSEDFRSQVTVNLLKDHPDPPRLVEALEQILDFTKRSNANSRMIEIFDEFPDVPRPVEWSAVSQSE